MKAKELGEAVSRAAGLDKPGGGSSAYDPEEPVDVPHGTHTWNLGARWAECATCGTRDYWPGGSVVCLGLTRETESVTLRDAIVRLLADVRAFSVWWIARPGLGLSRPTVNDWAAEFWEWRRGRKTA